MHTSAAVHAAARHQVYMRRISFAPLHADTCSSTSSWSHKERDADCTRCHVLPALSRPMHHSHTAIPLPFPMASPCPVSQDAVSSFFIRSCSCTLDQKRCPPLLPHRPLGIRALPHARLRTAMWQHKQQAASVIINICARMCMLMAHRSSACPVLVSGRS